MAQYRKKPVIIEAIQWTGENLIDAMAFMPKCGSARDGTLTIETLEGNMAASPNDWIIRGVKGEFYPCKPDIFEATYDAV